MLLVHMEEQLLFVAVKFMYAGNGVIIIFLFLPLSWLNEAWLCFYLKYGMSGSPTGSRS